MRLCEDASQLIQLGGKCAYRVKGTLILNVSRFLPFMSDFRLSMIAKFVGVEKTFPDPLSIAWHCSVGLSSKPVKDSLTDTSFCLQ